MSMLLSGCLVSARRFAAIEDIYTKGTDMRVIYAIDDSLFTDEERLTLASLQGLLSKKGIGLYRLTNQGAYIWLESIEDLGTVTVNRIPDAGFTEIIGMFRDEIDGYIFCELHEHEIEYVFEESLSVALTLAGPLNSIVVTSSTLSCVDMYDIPMALDARTITLEEAINEFDMELNRRQVIYRPLASTYTCLTDFGVLGNMIDFYGSLYNDNARSIFDRLEPHSELLGWGGAEDALVDRASSEGVFVHAADFANNLSVLSRIPVSVKQSSPETGKTESGAVHTVCFVMTDGDNIQWLLNGFAVDQRWYGSPFRGKVNVGWTVSPAMATLAPTVLDYLYSEASSTDDGRDYFIAGPSGVGYIYPDMYKDIEGFAQLTSQYMQLADLSIVNIIEYGRSGDELSSYAHQKAIDAIFLYGYSSYSRDGSIEWLDGKPIISGRFNLWEGFFTPEALAERLNRMPRDSQSVEGYSLIPVHVWSRSLEDVYRCASLLDDGVQVVTPDEFVALILKNRPGL